MKKLPRRTGKGYNGTEVTTRQIVDLLPNFMKNVGSVYKDRPDLVIAAWPGIIGPRLAPMTQALSLIEGTLTVKVTNSTLHSLLNQHEKRRLLRSLKEKFPNIDLKIIKFRIG